MSKKIIKAGILAGLTMLIIGQLVDYIVQIVPSLTYDIFAVGGMRAQDDPVMMLFFLHTIVLATAMAYLFDKTKASFKGDETGKRFGIIMWLVVSIPSMFLVYTSMNYHIGFFVSGLIGSFLYMQVAGRIIAKILK